MNRWLVAASPGAVALLWFLRRRRQSDLSDLDHRLAGQIERLGQRESELERQVSDLRTQELELADQVERLGQQEDALEKQVNGIGEREERLQREIDHLRDRETDLESEVDRHMERIKELQQYRPDSTRSSWHLMVPYSNFQVLVHLAQQQLSGIQIPDEALQGAKQLSGGKEKNWLRDTWMALGSLHEYASTDHRFHNYMAWTKHSNSDHRLSEHRVSMSESESTMNTFRETRVFPVDPRVDPSGYVEMQAHLKIQSKGSISPRVHFFDDTEGETGLVHIGYIGPHLPIASGS